MIKRFILRKTSQEKNKGPMKKPILLLVVLITAFSGNSQTAKQWLNKGLIKFAQEDYYGAMFDFMKAIEKNPKIAEAYYNMGLTRRALNQGRNPIDPTINLMQFNPGKTGAETRKETSVCQIKDYKGILDSLDEVIINAPKDAKLYFDRKRLISQGHTQSPSFRITLARWLTT